MNLWEAMGFSDNTKSYNTFGTYIKLGIGAHIQVPPKFCLQRTSGRVLDHGDELDNVGVDAHDGSGADADHIELRLCAGLHAQAQIRLERGTACGDGHGKGLAADPVAVLVLSAIFIPVPVKI